MKLVTITSLAALTFAIGASAQTGFGFSLAPTPFFQLVSGTTVPGATIASIHHSKQSNNPDGEWTTCLTLGALEPMWGGDGVATGVHIIRYDPSAFVITSTTEANALNAPGLDTIHLSLSADGLTAIMERKSAGTPASVLISTRAAVGTAFPAPTAVSGFPASGLSSLEYHPYIGTVGGRDKCFYADGTDLVMQDIDVPGAALTGSPVVVAHPVQVGVQAGAPSPIIGADGDVEALWATDIVIPQSGPTTGDSDNVFHNDLMPGTPGMVRIQRSDWRGWGSIAGGLISFAHDRINFHAMHVEGAILLGDAEAPGGSVDIRTQAMNRNGNSLTGIVFLAPAPGPATPVVGWNGAFALSGPLFPGTLMTNTTDVDGIADTSFLMPAGAPSGGMVAIQALMVDLTDLVFTWSNTAWIHVL